MRKQLTVFVRLVVLALSALLLLSLGACQKPAAPEEPTDDTNPTPDTPNPDGGETPTPDGTDDTDVTTPDGDTLTPDAERYNPHADRANGQTDITLREYSIVSGTLLQPDADDAAVPVGLAEAVNRYMTQYDAIGVEGAVTNFQQSGGYRDVIRINTEAVMAYVSVPSQLESTISSWENASDYYKLNIMMPINRDSHDYVLLDDENFGHIQTDASGKYLTHSTSDKVYYMVPTEGWTEYIWDMVEDILEKYDVDSITFEEPEMWYASGYSDGFKEEWEDYYGEPWQDQKASPEAMLKTMRLKVYLFDRALSTIAQRMHKIAPDTKLYVASHSTASYTSIAITAGLNSYLATGEIDGVIGQTWTNTSVVPVNIDGTSRTVAYENAYLGYASYAGASGNLDLFAITDTMADGDWEESRAHPVYHSTLVAALMQSEIHRFEASVWPSRGFSAVTSEYRTEQLNCFEALNEMSGKAITTSAGTPGITYLLSDSLSWQTGSSSWALSNKDSYYGVTMPLVSDGIPLRVQSMENVKSAKDLEDVTLLIISWDCQKPLEEVVVDSIVEWIKDGGTALYVGGHDKFEESDAEWWADYGTPLQALLDKLGLDVTVTAPGMKKTTKASWNGSKATEAAVGMTLQTKYASFYAGFEGADVNPLMQVGDTVYAVEQTAGKGTLIAVGIPSAVYAQQVGGTAAMRALAAYACESAPYEYVSATLSWTKRGRIVAAHSFADDNVLVGKFIDLFDPTLPIIEYKQLNANDEALLCDISEADLSIPRILYSGGSHMCAPVEAADKTMLLISGPAGTTISTRIACRNGLYPQSVSAKGTDGVGVNVHYVWDNETDSLLVQILGTPEGVQITVEWGTKAVEDTKPMITEEIKIKTNNSNQDAALIYRNTAAANSSFRYADATAQLIYKIDLSLFRNALISMDIKQNYLIAYSTDAKSWTTLADYSKTEGYNGTLQGGGNDTIITLSAAALNGSDVVYIRISDCNPGDGWGGTIASLSITYQRYEDEDPITLEEFLGGAAEKEEDDAPSVDTSGFEALNVDYASKYKNREKLVLDINSANDADEEYLVSNTGSSNTACRYTDLKAELVYCFDLLDFEDAVVVATVSQNYLVQVSEDGKTWTTIQDYQAVSGTRLEGGSNKATIGIAASKYAKKGDYLYIRFANADTQSGWGTALHKLEIYYED